MNRLTFPSSTTLVSMMIRVECCSHVICMSDYNTIEVWFYIYMVIVYINIKVIIRNYLALFPRLPHSRTQTNVKAGKAWSVSLLTSKLERV